MAQITVRNRNLNKVDKNGKAKKPNWEYRFEAARVNGKRNQISKAGFKTKAEALEAGTAALAEYNNSGKTFEPSEISVADFFDYWLKNYCEVNLADSTTHSYNVIVNNHVKPKLGFYRLKSIDTIALQEFVNSMYVVNSFSKEYIKNIIKVLSQGFSYARKTAKLIASDPMEDVTLPNMDVPEEEMIILSKEQVATILDRLKKAPNQYYAILIAYYTGLRVSEVYGLTWDDIDFEKKTLTVNKIAKKFDYNSKKEKGARGVKGKARTKWYLGACKTKSSYRKIQIGDTLLNALLDYKEWQEHNEETYGEYYVHTYVRDELTRNNRRVKRIIQMDNSSGAEIPMDEVKMVCVKENGEFMGTDSMKYPSKVINGELGIRFNFHALRHTHATMLIEQGLPIKAVSERLGHASTQITWDVYVNVTNKMETEVVETFEEGSGLKLRNEKLYSIWKETLNKKNITYYKERGITVCEEWLDFKAFEEWSESNGYEDGLRLLRVDKAGNYEPDNCVWGTEAKSVRGDYIYSDGENIKSYSVKRVGRGWQYRITNYDEHGKRKDISKAGFPTENDAAIAAEGVIHEMFKEQKKKPKLRLVK